MTAMIVGIGFLIGGASGLIGIGTGMASPSARRMQFLRLTSFVDTFQIMT